MMPLNPVYQKKTTTLHSNRVGNARLPEFCRCGARFRKNHYPSLSLYVLRCPTERYTKFCNMKGAING
jgi:hypothetical protein